MCEWLVSAMHVYLEVHPEVAYGSPEAADRSLSHLGAVGLSSQIPWSPFQATYSETGLEAWE